MVVMKSKVIFKAMIIGVPRLRTARLMKKVILLSDKVIQDNRRCRGFGNQQFRRLISSNGARAHTSPGVSGWRSAVNGSRATVC